MKQDDTGILATRSGSHSKSGIYHTKEDCRYVKRADNTVEYPIDAIPGDYDECIVCSDENESDIHNFDHSKARKKSLRYKLNQKEKKDD